MRPNYNFSSSQMMNPPTSAEALVQSVAQDPDVEQANTNTWKNVKEILTTSSSSLATFT